MSQITDRRLLTSEAALTGSLAKLLLLEPKTISDGGPSQIGFVAQDVLAYFPENVTHTVGDNGTVIPPPGPFWSVRDYWEWLSTHLVVGIKEVKALIDSLTSTVATKATETISAEQNLGTATYSATTPLSGTVTKVYKWGRQGKLVTVWWSIQSSVAGVLVTGAAVPLPSDMPAPFNFSNQATNSWLAVGSGFILSSLNLPLSQAASGLFKNSGGTYELRVNAGGAGLSANNISGTLTYLAA